MKGNKKNPMNIVLESFEKCMLTLNREMLAAMHAHTADEGKILDACFVCFCMYAVECGNELIYMHIYD